MSQATNAPEYIKPFTVRFPRSLHVRLGRAAVENDMTKQDIVQAAVTEYLERLEVAYEIRGGGRHGKTA